MIPKKIHYFWFGGPKTRLAERCIASWRRHCPGWEIVEWNESNADIGSSAFASAAFASRFKANAAFTFAALVVVLQLPFLKGWAILPAAAFFVYLGEVLFDECDIA